LKNRLEEWCHNKVEVKVKKNTYDFSRQRSHASIRDNLSIGDNDVLIARTTRIIPQKRIDRDIHLVHRLNQLFRQDDIDRQVFLVAAGDPHENYACYQELVVLAKRLKVEPFIKFIGSLPHACMPVRHTANTIEDLYYSCDLVSFLTSWDYDSYGNPVGEAISAQRCYITTSYEYYWEVYGQHGFEAPVMEISEENDGLPDDAFIADVYRLLNDKQRMDETARKNFLIGEEVISNNVIGILDLA
jgi:glycosyltransferase involved in cell wall biosynthesis